MWPKSRYQPPLHPYMPPNYYKGSHRPPHYRSYDPTNLANRPYPLPLMSSYSDYPLHTSHPKNLSSYKPSKSYQEGLYNPEIHQGDYKEFNDTNVLEERKAQLNRANEVYPSRNFHESSLYSEAVKTQNINSNKSGYEYYHNGVIDESQYCLKSGAYIDFKTNDYLDRNDYQYEEYQPSNSSRTQINPQLSYFSYYKPVSNPNPLDNVNKSKLDFQIVDYAAGPALIKSTSEFSNMKGPKKTAHYDQSSSFILSEDIPDFSKPPPTINFASEGVPTAYYEPQVNLEDKEEPGPKPMAEEPPNFRIMSQPEVSKNPMAGNPSHFSSHSPYPLIFAQFPQSYLNKNLNPRLIDMERESKAFSNYPFCPNLSVNENEPEIQSLGEIPLEGITIPVESLLFGEPRKCRPPKVLLLIRGLPGSGKSSLARLIKEIEMCKKEGLQGSCRVLSIDDYFVVEDDIKIGSLKYEYDPDLFTMYKKQLFKAACSQMDNAIFTFLIVEAPFERKDDVLALSHECTKRNYQIFVIEMDTKLEICCKRSVGRNTVENIKDMAKHWEHLRGEFVRLDCTLLQQEIAIKDIEMDLDDEPLVGRNENDKINDKNDIKHPVKGSFQPILDSEMLESSVASNKQSSEASNSLLQNNSDFSDPLRFIHSKWDDEDIETKKERLDGLSKKFHHHDSAMDINEFLSSPFKNFAPSSKPNKKGRHVTWGDVELLKKYSRQREVGFVMGQTDWRQMVDPKAHELLLKDGFVDPGKTGSQDPNDYTLHMAEKALVKIKFI